MQDSTKQELESRLSNSIANIDSVSGGCINQAFRITLQDGREFFAKTNSSANALSGGMFDAEAAGLIALRSTGAFMVPDVVAVGCTQSESFLVLEWIESGRRSRDYSQQLGRRLAALHQFDEWKTNSESSKFNFGFDGDNFLGSTSQPNQWNDCWIEFWRQHRLGHQLQLASTQSFVDPRLLKLGENLLHRLEQILDAPESASLLHGDLWSGNVMCNVDGEPVLVDPACYMGHREAEFGMITLFGGFDEDFYAAYNEGWPMEDGCEERVEIYRLYHLLNHLNLFGPSYQPGCLEILQKFA